MKTAKFIKEQTSKAGADQRLYKLSEPLDGNEYVIVSAVTVAYTGRPETFIFAANPEGKVTDWMDLEGSYQGGLNHKQALKNAGYTVLDHSER